MGFGYFVLCYTKIANLHNNLIFCKKQKFKLETTFFKCISKLKLPDNNLNFSYDLETKFDKCPCISKQRILCDLCTTA